MPSQEIVDYERKMTKRVLWKLDCHVLPPLALVSSIFVDAWSNHEMICT